MGVQDSRSPHLQHFVQTILDCAICLLKPDGRIVRRNPGAERLYRYRAGEVLGQEFAILFRAHEQQIGAPAATLRLACQTGRAEPSRSVNGAARMAAPFGPMPASRQSVMIAASGAEIVAPLLYRARGIDMIRARILIVEDGTIDTATTADIAGSTNGSPG